MSSISSLSIVNLAMIAQSICSTTNNTDSMQYKIIEAFKHYFQSIYNDEFSPQSKAILSFISNNPEITISQLSKRLYTDTGAISSQVNRLTKRGYVSKVNSKFCVKNYIKLLLEDKPQ